MEARFCPKYRDLFKGIIDEHDHDKAGLEWHLRCLRLLADNISKRITNNKKGRVSNVVEHSRVPGRRFIAGGRSLSTGPTFPHEFSQNEKIENIEVKPCHSNH